MIDDLILLGLGGYTMYHVFRGKINAEGFITRKLIFSSLSRYEGKADKAVAYFESELHCPAKLLGVNPADYLLDAVSEMTPSSYQGASGVITDAFFASQLLINLQFSPFIFF